MIDATVGGALADSYLSVAAADALAARDLGSAALRWLQATTTVAMKERALVRATREIDAHLLTSGGTPYTATQALLYPRTVDSMSTLTIASSSVANPTLITTVAPHGFASGQTVVISGHASTPALDGSHVITVVDAVSFTVPVDVTVGATGGSLTNEDVPSIAVLPSGIRNATYAQAKFLNAGGADMADASTMRAARGMLNAAEPNISYTQDLGLDRPFLSHEALAHLASVTQGGRATVKSVRVSSYLSDPLALDVLA